jgi:C1A family cysteine protease
LLLFLAVTLVAAVSSEGFAQQPTVAPKKYIAFPTGPTEFGYVGPPHDLSHIQPFQDGRDMLMAPAASWDWRTMSGVTPVKNQNPYGTCWAFAACGDLESKVLINESVVYDYSELNIQACNISSNDCNAGGNAWMSTNYLSLLGSVDESCDTYPGGCPLPSCINPSCSYLKQVTEWKVIANDVDAIKAAIQTYGPVYTSMYASFPGFSTYNGSGCLSYAGGQPTNHGVLIVGWDDDLCGAGVGGWIVKNSWGTSWGDNGYFNIQWGSGLTGQIGANSNVITGFRDYDPNMTTYYYDDWGWWSSVGYSDGHDYAVVEITPQAAGEYVHSLHFWATGSPTTYTVSLYDDFNGTSMPTSLLAGPFSGTVNEAGYYTIDLPAPVMVSTGNQVYIFADLNTGSYGYPIPYDDTGPMETNKSFLSNTGSSFAALDAGNYNYGDIGLRASIGPPVIEGNATMDGDPGFYFDFEGGTIDLIRGENWCFAAYAMNYGWASVTCPDGYDTFAVVSSDLQGWPITNTFLGFEQGTEGENAEGKCYIINDDGVDSWYFVTEVCLSVPCEALVGELNTLTLQMAYCDDQMGARPDVGDCENPNMHSGVPRYSLISQDFEIVASPPALYILQDTLYYVEQGQTAAYIPFAICNGDPCSPAADYDYLITSLGNVGTALNQTGTAVSVVGGTCGDVYGIVDAGTGVICTYDTLTIIAWDAASGTVYDTCVQAIHVIEPVPVPVFSAPVVTLLVLAMLAAAAIVMKRVTVDRS